MNIYDVIIIGSGPAGYTAAVYTSRAFLKTLQISGTEIGGQLTTTTDIENFPGFEKGIPGPQLMEIMKQQAARFGTEIRLETAQSLKIKKLKNKKEFTVTTETAEYTGRSVIIATGASAKYLGIPSEQKFRGKGVSACATCDGFFFKGREVVVIGGGDTAMEEANFLTRFASKVTIIHRRDQFRASPIMLSRAQKNPKITFLTNQDVLEVLGTDTVSGVRLKDKGTGAEAIIPAQGFFIAIGHKPNTEFLQGLVDIDEKGYIKLMPNRIHKDQADKINIPISGQYQTNTSQDGIFAAGDCTDPHYRQAVVAAGMGCQAAIDAQNWLEANQSK